jgi:hypothetical protein
MLEKLRGFWHLPEGFWRLPTVKEVFIALFILLISPLFLIVSNNSDQIMQGNSYKSRALKETLGSVNLLFIAFLGWGRFYSNKEFHRSNWFFGVGSVMALSYSIWKLAHYLPILLGGK